MFKNLTLYRISAAWPAKLPQLEEALARNTFTECRPTQEQSTGWAPPRGEAHGALAEAVNGHWILRFMIETRLLPASVVRRAVAAKLEAIEAKTGRKPSRQQARELREQITAELLPQAFTRQAGVGVWIDPRARLLAVDTAAKAKADLVIVALIRSLDRFNVALLDTRTAPATAMAHWLAQREAPGEFDLDRECELKSTDEAQAAVRYSRHPLDIAEIRRHIDGGKQPTRLGLTWSGRVSCVLTDTLQIKKIRFLEGVFKEAAAEDEDRFDADAAIATGDLARLTADLVEALGGEAVPA
ncbi:MAG: recombination-associated protein RdgC [Burkholderiales bacterium]|nr:recombination-associated protein RdgC [Burkholderiales bacterium]